MNNAHRFANALKFAEDADELAELTQEFGRCTRFVEAVDDAFIAIFDDESALLVSAKGNERHLCVVELDEDGTPSDEFIRYLSNNHSDLLEKMSNRVSMIAT